MVDVTDLVAKDFEDTVVINPENVPEGSLEIMRAERVEIKNGVSAGQEKLVMGLRVGEETYSWFPNKTSVGIMVTKLGNDTDSWIGKSIELTTEAVMVSGKKKQMILVKE